jgi:hypothetical protein
LKKSRFPGRVLKLDFERDILAAEQKLINTYGFLKEEINFVMKYKPSFILLDHVGDKEGMHALNKFFVQEKGFDLDAVRTLVVKYPYILGKTTTELE